MKERNSLPKRVGRYARVSTRMAGVAASAAGRRLLSGKTDHTRIAAELRGALGGLKGPLMKVAQMLATIPDAVPPEYMQELAALQADAPAMGWLFVKRRMAAELGPDWQGRFGHFDQQASAAASLGQVHRAMSHDGIPLACKLQYPDMDSAVEADLRQLKLIFAIFERLDGALQTHAAHAEISARLREELDYRREARHIALYQKILRALPDIHLPTVWPDLSTRRLLTMSWLEGVPLVQITKRSQTVRNAIALTMFRAWYEPFYGYGVIHGDPHLGNYSVRPDNSINLLDFGCVRVFPAPLVQGVIDLYHALQQDDTERAVAAYRAWGFISPSKEVIAVLNMWARFIYTPLLEDRVRPIEETNSTVYGRATAAKVHAELRRIGGVTIPREFVFMDRAAIGLGGVFLRLRAEVNWYRQFQSLIEGFSVATLAKQQLAALRSVGLA